METLGTPLAFTPPPAHLPATVVKLHVQPGHQVTKTQAIFSYSYHVLNKTDNKRERVVSVWESPLEGRVTNLAVREGDILKASRDPLIYIEEPCTHDVQLHGLCALCGKDLTQVDYTGFSDTSRADISMVHDSGGLTVSLEEAHRLETLTTLRLVQAKKLSLIVDLDQTIIHATVDPTVGEWLEDEKNPNWKALEGTQKFKLGENTEVGTDGEEGCWYYVKMRPGLQQFLSDVSKMYEMHVYTMGTRAYASEVCKIIDPDGGLFGGRILSRDESGSLTRKSLQRLFPCDTNMVVIIDDRADVWDGSPNLVKVVPYDFFVGIGDINAGFLPKKKELSGAEGPAVSKEGISSKDAGMSQVGAGTKDDILVNGETSSDSTIISPSLLEAEASVAIAIHEQIENRPLSKTQATVTEEEDEEEDEVALLKDDDDELSRVYEILKAVRDKFFEGESANPDVKTIIPAMKRRVLSGCHIVFSGVVALGSRPEDSEHWKMATLFGAKCFADLGATTTHVVANQNGTAKVHRARRDPRIQIVWTKWLLDSLALWARQPESQYLIPDPSAPAYVPIASALPAPLLPPIPPSDPPSPTSSVLNGDSGLPLGSIDIDWGAANDEVDEFLNETDDDTGGDGGESTDDGGSVKSVSNGRGRGGTKRARETSDSEDDHDLPLKLASSGSVATASPLQKRVRTSLSRKSRLKVSFPPDNDDEKDNDGEGGDKEAAVKNRPMAFSPPPPQPDGYEASVGGSSSDDEDDEEFLNSMAADLEKGWGGT